MKQLYKTCIDNISGYFYQLESMIDHPHKIHSNEFYVYRYSEKNINEAMVQKLTRVITGLKCIYLLNTSGFLQEQASLQRVHDELTEDILFLAYAIIFDNFTDKHVQYLEAFYQEEIPFLQNDEKPKATLPRRKIRAYINSFYEENPSAAIEASKSISQGYSGYIHAASPQIMELYYGDPPYFHISGIKDSPLFQDHEEDLLNYFYRSILSFSFVAKALGNQALFDEIHQYSKEFAINSGESDRLTEYLEGT